jgi:hypothetical protein
MAIEKATITKTLKEVHQVEIDKLEAEIDKRLGSSYMMGQSVEFNVEGHHLFVIEEIKKKFINAGWTIKENKGSSQRDGDWYFLIFY